MNIKSKHLNPDVSKAITKLTLTITAYTLKEDDEIMFVQTTWLVDGKTENNNRSI